MIKIPIYESKSNQLVSDELSEVFEQYMAINEGKTPTLKHIEKAIKNRKYVGIYYEEKGKDGKYIVEPGFRLIEPYVLGKGYILNGNLVHEDRTYLRAFVIKDSYFDRNPRLKKISRRKSKSKTKRVPYWRLFRLDRIQKWNEFNVVFSGYRKLYNPDDKQMGEILFKIEKKDFPDGEVNNK